MKGDDWTMAHQTADAKRPPSMRSACTGTFRVESNDGKRPAVAVCDECGDVIGVRQSIVRAEPPARPTEAIPF